MKCPKCSSTNVARERRPDGNDVCGDCHHVWPSKETPQSSAEELERAANAHVANHVIEGFFDWELISADAFKAGAEWQSERDKETIEALTHDLKLCREVGIVQQRQVNERQWKQKQKLIEVIKWAIDVYEAPIGRPAEEVYEKFKAVLKENE